MSFHGFPRETRIKDQTVIHDILKTYTHQLNFAVKVSQGEQTPGDSSSFFRPGILAQLTLPLLLAFDSQSHNKYLPFCDRVCKVTDNNVPVLQSSVCPGLNVPSSNGLLTVPSTMRRHRRIKIFRLTRFMHTRRNFFPETDGRL